MSVRSRLTVAVTVWTALALGVTGVAIGQVAEHRVLTAASAAAQESISAFRESLRTAPETPAREATEQFALEALVGPDLAVVSIVDDIATARSGTTMARRDVARRAAAGQPAGGSSTVHHEGRTYAVSVVEVSDDDTVQARLVVLNDVTDGLADLRDLMVTYALICLAVLIVTALSAWWIAGGVLRPLRRLQRTAASITAAEDLDRRVSVTGRDDLSRLQATVNAMLDRLEAAFTSQRHLLDDVGHELRTPLTIIRGHLETVDPGDRAAVVAAVDLTLDEVDRTTRLVDDLRTLADARAPQFVRPVATDVGELVEQIARKASALGDRTWLHGVTPTASSPRRAVLDPQRVTQAVLQLAENAVEHTRAGATVEIAATLHRSHLDLVVADSGPGIATDDRQRIFARFGRGHADRDGHGLGLAIATAIASAHGGDLALLETSPLGGAAFRMRLPQEGP